MTAPSDFAGFGPVDLAVVFVMHSAGGKFQTIFRNPKTKDGIQTCATIILCTWTSVGSDWKLG